ncbi:glycosyltransferase [Bacillus sp. PS06]|uniref:glycosyltransferase n=1 Tax=Bacillus sp. PS06 TaxID=2764176 RepID=UPI001785CCE5|nr:glycosyltransferase [Bacillus sp. PS06]MBD8071309.1 glycosyltransferase [Bacillus sp. PS06]
MKNIIIASYDMEVGGVERSLISMLNNFDYKKFDVDLMLYRHQGDFMKLLPSNPRLLEEISAYTTFRKSISETFRENHFGIGFSRVFSKIHANFYKKIKKVDEPGYFQMQLMWKHALPLLPAINTNYDVAISYLWPHYFIAEKVNAKKKIAWIHTDYSKVETNFRDDLEMWNKFDHIIAVSEACKESFINKYKELESKTTVIENLTSPDFIKKMGSESIQNSMLGDSRFKLLTVARLSHAKGIDNAIRALSILKEKGMNDIVWYIVGYGGDEPMLKEMIKNCNLQDNFVLLGKKENPYPYIKACDLYVQPSRYEGKAVTVTEAKILAKPILITNYSTASSQLVNGIEGVICDQSVEGLVKGIEEFYVNPELKDVLINNLKGQDYSNSYELDKLYNIIS